MSWYAIDAIDDSLDATRAFLFPFSLGRWARLALITLLIGGGGAGVQNVSQSANSVGQFAGSGTGPGGPGGSSFALATLFGGASPGGGPLGANALAQVGQPVSGALPAAVGIVGLLVIAAVVLLAILVAIASPVLEFVFVHAIARDEVRIRGPFKRHFWKGIRLLLFRIGLTILFALPFVIAGAVYYFGFHGTPPLGLGPILGIVFLVVLWFLLFALVMGFTTQFVVPVMYVDDSGVLAGWSEVWSLLGGEKVQTVVYLFMHLLVGIGVAIVRGLLTLLGLIPVGIISVIVGLAAGTVVGGTVAPDLGIGIGFLAGLAVGVPLYFVFVFLPLNVLTQTYIRTFELASLAGFSSRYDTLGRYRDGSSDDEGGSNDDGDGSDGDGGTAATGRPDDEDDFDEFVAAEDLVDDEGESDGVRDSGTTPAA
ncbi:DUF7544 domain-containing protein [Halorarum halobium]|uniref:DUF7544 domain-containing protein n=1 Tax=Halorarum halobium TaxID=3075121 RepID=UPI0028ABFE21|nr:hypothetical protein [Halobaculum sp. XH14]